MSISYIGNAPGSSVTSSFADQKVTSWFSGPTTSGEFVSMRVYPYGNGGVLKKYRGIIYSSVSGEPDVLCGRTPVFSSYGVLTSSDWVDVPLEVPYSFVSGEEFYLGIHCDENGGTRRNLTGSWPPTRYNSDEFDDGPSDPFGTGTSSAIYVRILAYYAYGSNYEVPKAVGFAMLEQRFIGVTKAAGFALIENLGVKVSKAVGYALISEPEPEQEEGANPFVVFF